MVKRCLNRFGPLREFVDEILFKDVRVPRKDFTHVNLKADELQDSVTHPVGLHLNIFELVLYLSDGIRNARVHQLGAKAASTSSTTGILGVVLKDVKLVEG